MILKKADVFIQKTGNGLMKVITNEERYQIAKTVLMTLKSDFGLPVSCQSEELAESLESMSLSLKNVLTLNGTKVHKDCEFLIVAWQIGVRSDSEMQELAEEIASHLRRFDLEVSVMVRSDRK